MRRPNGPDDHAVGFSLSEWEPFVRRERSFAPQNLSDALGLAASVAHQSPYVLNSSNIARAFNVPNQEVDHVSVTQRWVSEWDRRMDSDPAAVDGWCPGLRADEAG